MAASNANALKQATAMQQLAGAGTGQPLPPLTSQGLEKEKERVGLLFEINQVLFQDLASLQQQGKGGRMTTKMGKPEESSDDPNNKAPAPEYTECWMRLQANLTYIAANTERHTKPADKMPPGPAIMAAPESGVQSSAELNKLYTRLQQLFPGWTGRPKPQSPHTSVAPGSRTAPAAT